MKLWCIVHEDGPGSKGYKHILQELHRKLLEIEDLTNKTKQEMKVVTHEFQRMAHCIP